MAARVFGMASTVAALMAISLLFDLQSREWWGAWLLVLAWLLGRASDSADADARRKKDGQ